MEKNVKWLFACIAVAILSLVIYKTVTYPFKQRETISVKGLGETEFESDLIVWSGKISTDANTKEEAYRNIGPLTDKVKAYFRRNGIADSLVQYDFINTDELTQSVYNNEGNYCGSRRVGYRVSQPFTIQSRDLNKIESVSRGISSLLAQGISVDSYSPKYYYTKLDDLKIDLINRASKDAYNRASCIAENTGASINKAIKSNLGIFQITSAMGDDDYSYGGTFNTSSRLKKASVTVNVEFSID